MYASVATFISYSHDSLAHIDRVVMLASRLRDDGIDVDIDQWITSPPEGWPLWMERQIRTAQFVLVVCTEAYNIRCAGEDQASQGRNVRWESLLTHQHLYNAGSENHRFVPILFAPEDEAHIPLPLSGASFYDLSDPNGYEKLYRRLTNQHKRVKPPLGVLKSLPVDHSEVARLYQAPLSTESYFSSQSTRLSGYSRFRLREFLTAVLVGDADLEAFCGDFFPEVKQLFGSDMIRIRKLTLLLERESGDRIVQALQQFNQERSERFKDILQKAD